MFYDVLTRLCQEKERSLVQMRKDLGISQSTVASWKARGVTPNAATVAKLSEYFDVSVDYLLEKNVTPTPVVVRANEDMLQIASILELPPDKQEQFDKVHKTFRNACKRLCDLMDDKSIANNLLADESFSDFGYALLGLCQSIRTMQDINPEGINQLRTKYKKWNADMDVLSKAYGVLNNNGQLEAIKRIQELTQIRAYLRFPTDDEQGKVQEAKDRISEAEHELRLMEERGVTSGHAVESCKQIISEEQRRVGEIMLNRCPEQ